MKKVLVEINWSGDNYSASCTSVNGVVFVTNKSLEKVKKDFKDAFEFHIQGSIEDGDKLPAYISENRFKLDYKLMASAIMHQLDGVVTRAALSRVTGINEKQLGHYLQGHRSPRPSTEEKIIQGFKKVSDEILSVL